VERAPLMPQITPWVSTFWFVFYSSIVVDILELQTLFLKTGGFLRFKNISYILFPFRGYQPLHSQLLVILEINYLVFDLSIFSLFLSFLILTLSKFQIYNLITKR
jgi:hypothetical protein